MQSGIYKIINTINNKIYVGSTTNFDRRWRTHKYELNNNTHHNQYLQYAWNKYKSDSFNFIIVEYVNDIKLIEREQYYIDFYNANNRNFGYNLAPNAGNTLGFKFTENSKKKMSEAKRGKKQTQRKYPMSDETKKKIGEANKINSLGKKHSDITKKKMSDIRKNYKMSENTKKKLSDWRKGLIPSIKTGLFINENIKNILLSDDIKEKRIKLNKLKVSPLKGISLSSETKEKISKSSKGIHSGEKNGMAISNIIEVSNIRDDYKNGYKISNLMHKYNKKYMFIYKIVNNLTWKI